MSARKTIALMAAFIAAGALGNAAHACPCEDWNFGAQLHYELSTVTDIDRRLDRGGMTLAGQSPLMIRPDGDDAPRDLVLAGMRLHGFVGGRASRLTYHTGIDLLAGSTIGDAGFAYDVAFFPFGAAMRFGDTSFVSLGIGVGANGAVGTLDDAVTMPVETRFEIGRGVRVLGRARLTYLDGSPGRKDGGVTTELGDELEAMLGVRLGKAYTDYGMPTGNGYFLAATVRESMDVRYVGLVLGYSVDMSSKRKKARYDEDSGDAYRRDYDE